MKSFKRVFEYIWPQWPRIIVVVISAMIVSALLSLSFMTLIPLLKVMTGEEGLRGWLDRNVCELRYDMKFYIPQSVDFTNNATDDLAHHLQIISVDENSVPDLAGLKPQDRIIAIGDGVQGQNAFIDLLDSLANAEGPTTIIVIKRLNESTGSFEKRRLTLDTAWKTDVRGHLARIAQKAAGLVPVEQTADDKTKAVVIIILAIGIVTIVRCTAKFYQSYLAQKIVQVGINRLREDAFVYVMDMPMSFFAAERPSDVVSRLIRDTGAMGNGIKILLGKGLREPLNAVLLLTGAALLNWQLTLVFLCGAPPTLWMVSLLGRKMKKASRKSLIAWSQMLAKLQEVMTGLKVVKVYNQQKYEHAAFHGINKRLLKQLLRISKVDSATNPILEVLGMAAGSAALVVGASWVTASKMDGSSFLVMLGLLGGAADAVRKTSDIWNKIQEADAAAERVFVMMDEPLETEKQGAVELPALRGKIEFKNVVFTYPGACQPTLKGINLAVQAGHTIAIVGPNGSGKTTLANLIPRFYDPDSGQILIDGKDIQDVSLRSLRDQIAIVTQQIVTFNDTISANIGYGKPNADRQEIVEAARRAFVHEFVELLPDGYDSVIGEQGAGLSGGQLQRIAIARAILKNPPILIFDEATSQVDADSESKIHKAIEEIMHNKTSFVIAHRFSTIIAADVIVVMDKGQIVAQGRHEGLMRTCPLYQRLYETQLVRA
ncbi:MAG: ABC transporter transmembrane domain-containing protein [Planctomycetota bacterium]